MFTIQDLYDWAVQTGNTESRIGVYRYSKNDNGILEESIDYLD